jgi:hypothetical protein
VPGGLPPGTGGRGPTTVPDPFTAQATTLGPRPGAQTAVREPVAVGVSLRQTVQASSSASATMMPAGPRM